jgi:hypothetical protein
MDNFFLAVLTSIIPSIIVAVITAFITVKLSTKSFYTKRWWEKKVELYSSVIKRLTYLKKYVLKWHDSSEDKIVLDNIELNKFIKKYDEERGELREIESYGRLIISKRANERLINCMDELDNCDINNENEESIIKYLNDCLNILESCIDDFINYAQEDLKLNE